MVAFKSLAIVGITVCFFEMIFGIITAAMIGSAKKYYNDNDFYYSIYTNRFISYYFEGGVWSAVNYTLFIGISVAILSFVRLVLHIMYLRGSAARRGIAIADLVVASIWAVFLLACAIALPLKGGLFNDSYSSYWDEWVKKLRVAWAFVLITLLFWIATLVLAVVIVKKSGSKAATSTVPPTDAPKQNTQMHSQPAYVQGQPAYVQGQPAYVQGQPAYHNTPGVV